MLTRIATVFRTQRAEWTFGIDALCKVLETYLPQEQIEQVRRAHDYGAQLHSGQSRSSGEPYIYHPLAAARILADLRLDHTTIIAAILHDVLEDTEVTKGELQKEFGKDVADLVDGVSKIEKIEGMTRDERQAESFRKLLLAMTQDLRVILVKLADRLHNMRTLEHMNPEQRRRTARETLEIYAPIAHRLGIHSMRTELEDLAFARLHPKRYAVLQAEVKTRVGDTKDLIKEVNHKLDRALKEEGIGATVIGRQKNLYSIYLKMRRKRLKLLNVMDVIGFRVVTSKLDDCYRALGVVHHQFKPVPAQFDDYIANAKSNGYQSLHTTCIGPQGRKIEVQIRTRDMQHVSEAGIAAHWQYKTDGKSQGVAPQVRAREWLQGLFDLEGTSGAADFVDNVKVDLFPVEVYVFTPKGEIRRLPRGATPVDFAYAVHSELGDRCVAARLDGALESLQTQLRNGQTVEIITARHARPNAAWLHFVKTGKARSHIRNFLRNQREDEAVRLGRRLLEIALRELKLPASVLKDETAAPALKAFGLQDIEQLYVAVGTGERLAPLVARYFLPEGSTATSSGSGSPLAIEGTEGLVLDYARCCHPIPGDDIRGHVSVGRGIVVHRLDCRHAKGRPQDWVPLAWSDKVQGDYMAELRVKAENKRGLLARVTTQISETDSSIENVQMPDRAGGEAIEMRFIVTVKNRVHLARVLRRVRQVDGVGGVRRA